ncbi:MAG: hypothetical protein A3E01_10125 [Gammaproteobacteria bacterium RIFCSPHIGHO2_12_FULL_63_22]|nr:MAG: hypothetical protein A3E01_10125 [Gammaproteobacteria bacterium RIFCSPHIGHO2_12_FULL_63_22]
MLKADVLKKLDAIPEDEPLFLLRGRDPLAPPIVAGWATDAFNAGVGEAKVEGARAVAHAMADYHLQRLPD